METRIQEMAETLQCLPPRLLPHEDADVLVYRKSSHSLNDQCFMEHCCTPLLVRSTQIEALHSPLLKKLMGPYKQTIIKKQIEKDLPKYNSSPNMRYVLNLAPKLEGDEALEYMTTMSCHLGLRHWYDSTRRWSIGPALVGGRDEFAG